MKPIILADTARWLVVSKPPGWLTIPGRGKEDPSPVLLDWIFKTYGQVWTVHRLDRETSGVVLFAKSAESHREASVWFQSRKVRKTYHCLAKGTSRDPVFKVQLPIEGAPSSTQVEVKEKFQNAFFARVLPLTGRRHQIRIHLSAKGFPILGDIQYGGPSEIGAAQVRISIPRVALHASSLELPTKEVFQAELQDDFQSWLGQLRQEKVL